MIKAILGVSIGLKTAIETKDRVEQSDDIGETGLEIMASVVKDFLQMADHRDQRESGFNQHPLVPGSTRAQLEVEWNTIGIVEASIRQDNADILQGGHQRQKNLIMGVGGIPVPTHDFAPVIEQPAKLHSDDPAPVALASIAHLLRATALSDRMDQLNTVTIDDCEKGRLGQKAATPRLMGQQQPLQTGALRKTREQRRVILTQPTVESMTNNKPIVTSSLGYSLACGCFGSCGM